MAETDNFDTVYKQYLEALKKANNLNKTAVFDALASTVIDRIAVTFNGEGDSGQIEKTVAYKNQDPVQIPDACLMFQSVHWGTESPTSASTPLLEAIESLCYDFLADEYGGWENNDGAFGDFTFHVPERKIELSFNARYSEFVNHSHTL